ncbi:MAG: hypothetical protein NTV79_12130 [Candidatus Aureabacteria bacterium]|nr:hypothetical protein [Candidatus Auribacterota bacterium]
MSIITLTGKGTPRKGAPVEGEKLKVAANEMEQTENDREKTMANINTLFIGTLLAAGNMCIVITSTRGEAFQPREKKKSEVRRQK